MACELLELPLAVLSPVEVVLLDAVKEAEADAL